MTPLLRFFEQVLPHWLVYPALSLAYSLMLIAVAVSGQRASDEPIIYIDVRS